ncbi:MAG: DUF6702 family protein [Flavobacteriales bacterium]|nr:DUF6702 family protein [Flavobacteriales bacterium]
MKTLFIICLALFNSTLNSIEPLHEFFTGLRSKSLVKRMAPEDSLVPGIYKTKSTGIMNRAISYNLSNTIIETNPRSGITEINIKLFTNDLEQALQFDGYPGIKLSKVPTSEQSAAVRSYIDKHFYIKFQGQPTLLQYVGIVVDPDFTICSFEIILVPEYNFLEIKNSLLIEIYPLQRNIVDLRLKGKSQTLTFFLGKEIEILNY